MDLMQYVSNPWIWAIVALIVFAGLDLMVGVANDAVNFLNSAIGSKVASRKTIYRVAAAGILIGASFSGGMMEVARKGIFNPAMFTFYDIMIVFFSVVMADVILLDVYNSLKLPTSTTVSVVFELLGAGLAIALIHLVKDDLALSALGSFINASSTIAIITGIFMSVGIAFVSGWIIQTVARSLFTFEYKHHIKRWGWLLGGVAISAITYFLVLKGLKEAVWLPEALMPWIKGHTLNTLGILFVIWSIVSLIVQKILKRDILKLIVLIGTFALAAAFAGNDLVNFIGVSVAGYQSVMLYLVQGGDVTQFMMGGLAEKVATPQIFLFGSAIIMIVTLMLSKKAQSVTDTEIGLTRHATGQEQFKPGKISRWLVKKSLIAHKAVASVLPVSWQRNIAGRFVASSDGHHHDAPAFDLLRASINLTLSAILIAIATNMKLPLSTTYVTFMVAMGTALADGAWGRDSAVYRISGVLTIVGAWLLTAVIAMTLTLILTTVLWNLGFWAVGGVVVLVGYMLYRSHHHVDDPTTHKDDDQLLSANNLSDIIHHHAMKIVPEMKSLTHDVLKAMIKDDEDELTKAYRHAHKLASKTKEMKLDIHTIFAQVGSMVVETGHTYVQSIEVLRKAALSLESLAEQCQEYVLNKHPDLIHEQTKELDHLDEQIKQFIHESEKMIDRSDFGHIDRYDEKTTKLIDDLDTTKQLQFTRIKAGDAGVRNTTLYIGMMTELYTMVINLQKLVHYIKRMK